MKKLLLTWSTASLLALFYAACGDDVIHVHNDEYAIVDSLDSLVCNSENEGEMALVKSTGVLYACTDGEWTVVNASDAVDLRCKSEPLKDSTGYKIICDGKTIGTVQNGTDGQKGADGKAGQKGADGKAGQNGKEVNVDSVSKVISKKVTDEVIDEVIDSLACRVDSSWTDTKASLINVQISCGSGSSIIQLPTLVPNKNLTKHYKKTVMMRFPYYDNRGMYDYSNTAELTVMEVDSNFERTGKNFVSELYLSKQTKFTLYQNPNLQIVGHGPEYVSFLANDVDVTNMMNSYAQFRVRLERTTSSDNGRGRSSGSEGSSEIVYMAFVNMDDGDTIVVDFVSDYKAARIETLMKKKGTDFAKASKQANDEITEALALGKDFHAVEFYMSDSVENNEAFAALSWPMVLSNLESNSSLVSNYNRTYNDYRELFAKEGNFNTAINQQFYEWDELDNRILVEYPIFFIDYFVEFFNMGLYWEYEEIPDTLDTYEKFAQHGLKDAYELPACDLKQDPIYVSQVAGGMFKYFKCNGRSELWYPIVGFSKFVDEIASSIAGECNDSTAGKFFMIDSVGKPIVAECNGKSWTRSDDLKSALCKGKQDGSFVSGVGGRGYVQYFRCVADSTGNMVGDSVGYYEYAIGEQCNAKTKDTLYTIPNDEYFYICDTLSKSFVMVNGLSSSSGMLDTIARMQLGKCDTAKANEVGTIYVTTQQKAFVACELNGNGVGLWREADPTEVVFGVCTDSLMKASAIYKLDEYEWDESYLTKKEHYKCDCDYVWEETAVGEATVSVRSYQDCRWVVAGDLDLKLNKACNSSIVDTVVTSGNDEYTCDQIEKHIGSSSSIHRDWNQVDPDRECPRIVAPNGGAPWLYDDPCDKPCNYAGKTYYYSQKTEKWITLAQGETCVSIKNYCAENKQELEKEVCTTRATSECFTMTATVCLVKDTIHKETLMEGITYSDSGSSSTAYRTGEELCNARVTGSNDASYRSNNVDYSNDKKDYVLFLPGYTMNGVVLPEVFKIYRDSSSSRVVCGRQTDVQNVCTALHGSLFEEYVEEMSCDHPCEYNGATYYYNFRKSKWQTLAEMGLTTCPSMEDYCDDHNSLGVTCSAFSVCFDFQTDVCQFEDGTDCDCDDEDDTENGCDWVTVTPPSYCGKSLTCSYPFMQMEATCEEESGTWQTQI